jgi:hypothetical protein
MTRFNLLVLGVTAVAIAVGANAAYATVIMSEDWEGVSLAAGGSTSVTSLSPAVWGDDGSGALIVRPTTDDFDSVDPLASPAGGNNALKVSNAYVYRRHLSESRLPTAQANTDYTVTVDVGWSKQSEDNPGFAVDLFGMSGGYSDVHLGGMGFSTGQKPTNQGGWTEFSFTVLHTDANLQAAVAHNQLLQPWLATDSRYTVYFDNFRIDATTVPEPGTMLLATTGMISLLAYAWRRRK